ncbi:MAG: DNA polymerase [Candidatus Ozemobacteraceae bacterium]
MKTLADFRRIWGIDFEFQELNGHLPHVHCMVARDFHSGELVRLFGDELTPGHIPFDLQDDDLVVVYYGSAEIKCFKTLSWHLPGHILDLFTEVSRMSSGMSLTHGKGLLGALYAYGLEGIGALEKESMRELAMTKTFFSSAEKTALLNYCQSDVDALRKLYQKMLSTIKLDYALLRGRFMKAAGIIEYNGIPIDMGVFTPLSGAWDKVKRALIKRYDRHGIWQDGSFGIGRFQQFLERHQISWFFTEKGNIKTDDESFKTLENTHPEIGVIRELKRMLGGFNLRDIYHGPDGRNRCMLSAFRSKTGRNQPSNAHFIFGVSSWLRSLIKPTTGNSLAYIDWSQQEFGIAAALSEDQSMIEAYLSGDPYLAFPKQAGAVPLNATKLSHPVERAQFKQCILAVQYGMGVDSLATVLNESTATARRLLDQHKTTYRKFWEWSENVINYALFHGYLHTTFDWRVNVVGEANTRSLANFPMQANGAEMLRLACCLATEQGIKVCAPVHDAVLIEAPTGSIHQAVNDMQKAMEEASLAVIRKFPLRTDVKIINAPNRYVDEKRGPDMWNTVMEIIDLPECAISPS